MLFCYGDLLWENSEFIGNSYPTEVCEKLLRSMDRLSRIKPDRVIKGMTPTEFSVLCCADGYPKKNGGRTATVADIAAPLRVSVPAVSRTLRTLQEKGWIERAVDENDRRSVRVTVTPAGKAALNEDMKRVISSMNRIMSVFTEEEVRTVAELYDKFAASMTNELGGNA